MNLDPERVADARERASDALSLAAFHDSMAAAARSRALLLARTWGFEIVSPLRGEARRKTGACH